MLLPGKYQTNDLKVTSLNPETVIINGSILTDFYQVKFRAFPYKTRIALVVFRDPVQVLFKFHVIFHKNIHPSP